MVSGTVMCLISYVGAEFLTAEDSWLGVTYPKDKPLVQAGLRKLVNKGVYPKPLW